MSRKSILLMSRGRRLHRHFRDLAESLRDDHEVVVTAPRDEQPLWEGIGGVRVYVLDDLEMGWGFHPTDVERRRVAELETDLGLPLYRAGSNYILYKIFSKAYEPYGFRWSRHLETEEEIMGAYLGTWKVVSEILERHDPDVALFETIDLVSTAVAFAMLHARERFVFGFRYSPLGQGKIDLFHGFHRTNVLLEHFFAHPDDIPSDAWPEARQAISRFRASEGDTSYAGLHKEIHSERARTPWNLLRRGSFYKRLMTEPAVTFRRARARRWMEKHFERRVPDQPYLFFPLQYQPEASTCSEASRWVRQPWIVEQLSIGAPAGTRILVKEHPRAFGARGRDYYQAMTYLPNVHLVHPDVPTVELVRGSEAVFTLTGGTGFEAILWGRPVITLARPFYAVYPGVKRVDHPQDVFTALERFQVPEESRLEQFVAANLASLHDFGHGTAETFYLPEDGGLRLANALRETMRRVERFGLTPSDFDAGVADPL